MNMQLYADGCIYFAYAYDVSILLSCDQCTDSLSVKASTSKVRFVNRAGPNGVTLNIKVPDTYIEFVDPITTMQVMNFWNDNHVWPRVHFGEIVMVTLWE